jgi:hypothetical protein
MKPNSPLKWGQMIRNSKLNSNGACLMMKFQSILEFTKIDCSMERSSESEESELFACDFRICR